jgi:RecJ-like exonuclease
MKMVICFNCKGRDSSRWPFGRCTVCKGTGKISAERAVETRKARQG